MFNKLGAKVGICFAVDERHLITARHIIYKPADPVVRHDPATIQISTISASSSSSLSNQVTIETVNLEVVDGGANSGKDEEDWLILRRTDNAIFRNIILVRVTNDIQIKETLPFITIYYFPVDFHALKNLNLFMDHSENRVVDFLKVGC